MWALIRSKRLTRFGLGFLLGLCVYMGYRVVNFQSGTRTSSLGDDPVHVLFLPDIGGVSRPPAAHSGTRQMRDDNHGQKMAEDDGNDNEKLYFREYSIPEGDPSPGLSAYDTGPLENNDMDTRDSELKRNNLHYQEVGYNNVPEDIQDAFSSRLPPVNDNFKYVHGNGNTTNPNAGSGSSSTSLPSRNSSKGLKTTGTVKKPVTKEVALPNVFPSSLPFNATTTQQNETKYLVYLCDSASLCGGWGDRQRGLVSTYILSRLVDRQFRIIMTTPCNLRLFYKPNRVHWLPTASELNVTSNISMNALLDKSFQQVILSRDFNQVFPQRIVYLKTNTDYYERLRKNSFYAPVLNQWSGLTSRRSRFHWAWTELMQPSHMLLTHLKHIVGSQFLIRKGLLSNSTSNKNRTRSISTIGNSSLICAHVRMGKNPTNPMDEFLSYFKVDYLPTLFNFMQSKDLRGDAKFFVATDYDLIRSEAKKFFKDRIVNYGGKIVHIDRQRGDYSACVGFEVALIDQLILSLCDILVVCKSGFSINASYMSNNTGQIYFMKDGVIERI